MPLAPEARYEQTEAISLAFVTALQVLPPRQLAVLILRDVLGFHAHEAAEMLDSSVESVTSALNGPAPACSAGCRRLPAANRLPLLARPPSRLSWRTSSARGSPPISTRWSLFSPTTSSSRCRRSRSNTRAATTSPAFAPASSKTGRRFDLVPTRANGQPAFGSLPARRDRRPPRGRPLRPRPRRRPDPRHDPLREQRAPVVRATAIAPWPIVRFRRVRRSHCENQTGSVD